MRNVISDRLHQIDVCPPSSLAAGSLDAVLPCQANDTFNYLSVVVSVFSMKLLF